MKPAYETLSENIRETIRKARAAGTVGMSLRNLKQITPTSGLRCDVSTYHRTFPVAADDVAKEMQFNLFD